MVLCFCKVKEIESTLVAAHIPLTKNIHAADVATRLSAATRVVEYMIGSSVRQEDNSPPTTPPNMGRTRNVVRKRFLIFFLSLIP